MEKDRKLLCLKALITNGGSMMLYIIASLISLIAGLHYYFEMAGRTGYVIGIIMYCLSGLFLLIGMFSYFINRSLIKDDARE